MKSGTIGAVRGGCQRNEGLRDMAAHSTAQSGQPPQGADTMLAMATDTSSGSWIPARAFVAGVALGGILFDGGILEAIARANAPDWSRVEPGVELPAYHSDGWTFLSSGYVALVKTPASTK